MGNLNPKPVEIEFQGKTYRCAFTLNCIDEAQEHFDKSLTEIIEFAFSGSTAARNIRYLLTLLLNDSPDCETELSEKEVGAAIDIRSFDYYCVKILEALGVSLPDDDGDDLPEAAAGQG